MQDRRKQLEAELKEVQVRLSTAMLEFEAYRQLYSAACMSSNNASIEQISFTIHNIIDVQLDCLNSIAIKTRQMIQLG